MPSARLGDVSPTRPFVGREHERALVRQMLHGVEHGGAAFLLVCGIAGIGKTAFLRWAADEARARGAQVCRAASSHGAPRGSLARLFEPLPEVAECVRRAEEERSDPRTRESAVDDIVRTLAAQSTRRPIVVAIDDVDQLDSPSLLLVEEIWTVLGEQAHGYAAVLVVLSAREPLDPEGFAPRLLDLDTMRMVSLDALDDHAVFELVAAAQGRPDPGLVDDLLESTGGIPVLLEARIESLRADRSPRSGRRTDPGRNILVRRIRDALAARFDRIDDASRDLLACAALLGEPFDPDDLAAVTTTPPEVVEVAIDKAVLADLVDRDVDGLRFSHPLIRTELLARLPLGRQRTLRRQFARLLDDSGPGQEPDDARLVRIADQLVRAGPRLSSLADARIAHRAGGVAMRDGAWHQASRLLSPAADAVGESEAAGEAAGIHLDAGLAAFFDHDIARCEHHLARAIARAREAGDSALELRAATLLVRARAAEHPFRPGDRPDAAELDEALSRYGDGPLAIEAEAVRAEALLASNETPAALQLLAATRRHAGEMHPAPARGLCRLEFTEGIHLLSALDIEGADRCLRRGLDHAIAAGDNLELAIRSRRALLQVLRGRLADAAAALRTIEAGALDRRLWGEAGFATAQLALIEALAGDDEARGTLERAVRLYRRSGHLYTGTVLTPVAAALASRVNGADLTSSKLLAGADIRPSTAVAVLAAVEAGDAAATRTRLSDAHWRHGLRDQSSHGSLTIATALVEAGDLLGDASLVGAGAAVLAAAAAKGIEVTIGWPATVARLRAIAARHAGDRAAAVDQVDHAAMLCRRQELSAEYPKVVFELSRQEAAWRGPSDRLVALLGEAATRFDRLSMGGWLARCTTLANTLGLPPVAGELQAVGDCTILTTDIVSSTATNARLGNADYLEDLRVHDRLIRARLREARGREIKHTGDGVNAVFHDAGDAVRCALAIQSDFLGWQRREPARALQVRCGLARGAAIASGGDLYGLVQSEAARLCAMAAGGETLVSGSVAEAVDAAVAPRVSLGRHQLAGLPEASEVFRLHPPA